MKKVRFFFDEIKEGQRIYENGFSGPFDYKAMFKVAKYLRNGRGYGKIRLERALIAFCKSQDSDFNPVVYAAKVKQWSSVAMNKKARVVDSVSLRKTDLEVIKNVRNLRERKILFVITVLARALREDALTKGRKVDDKYRIFFSNLPDVINLSMQMSEDTLLKVMHGFVEEGLLTIYTPEKETILVNFINDDSPVEYVVNDLQNMLKEYKNYCGGEIIFCPDCGREMIRQSGSHERCKNCSYIFRKNKEKQRYYTKKLAILG